MPRKLSAISGGRSVTKNQLSDSAAKEAAAAVQTLLQQAIADLKGSAAARAGNDQRLFFPKGIELINVVLKIGPGDVEVTIAGDGSVRPRIEGARPTVLRQLVTRTDFMDVAADSNEDDIYRGDQLIWFNEGDDDVTIDFEDICPLNLNGFTVCAKGGMKLTKVRSDINSGPYNFTATPDGGTHTEDHPKIIIQ